MKKFNYMIFWSIGIMIYGLLSVSLHAGYSSDDFYRNRGSYEQLSYFGKVGKVFERKFQAMQTYSGVESTIDTLIVGTSTIVMTVALTVLMMYVQTKFLKNMTGEHVMKIYYPGQISLKFDDVAGLSGPKADMQDIITYLRNPDMYKNIGAKVPKGVLMNGSPGNGKTLLAKAVAGEVNCPFISVNGSAFVQMWVGLGAVRVRELFALARQLGSTYGACIIFIDEIDSLTGQRSPFGGNQEHEQTLNALLAEMDGLDVSGAPVIVLGATNRIDVIDQAVKRPGRFDRIAQINNPFIKDRVELLEIALKNFKHVPNININRVALATRGFSGAQLANLINEAAILTANAGRSDIDLADIELAFDNITLSRKVTGMEQDDDAKWKTAVHEAGHAIALLVNDKKHALYKVTIEPRANALGIMYSLPLYESYGSTKDDMMNTIVMMLSGRLAEEEFDMGLSTGASSDLDKTHDLAYSMVATYGMSDALRNIAYNDRSQLPNDIATQVEREVQKIINECTVAGKKIMKDRKKDIEKIAQLLMEKGTVLGDEIYNLLGLSIPKGAQFNLA